jgi:hypothetical protein
MGLRERRGGIYIMDEAEGTRCFGIEVHIIDIIVVNGRDVGDRSVLNPVAVVRFVPNDDDRGFSTRPGSYSASLCVCNPAHVLGWAGKSVVECWNEAQDTGGNQQKGRTEDDCEADPLF